MRVRNNTGRDYELTFKIGHGLRFSRGEVSRELTTEEQTDPWFIKAKQKRKVVEVREPAPPKPAAEPKPVVKVTTAPELEEEKPPTTRRKSRRKPRSAEENED